MRFTIIIATLWMIGCFGDDPLDVDFRTENTNLQGTDPIVKTTEPDAGVKPRFDLDLPEENSGPVELYAQDYVGFAEGNDSWGPAGTPPAIDYEHPGFGHARCFDCHATGKAHVPEGHNPKMDYWSWSCSRGFPGGGCHGHGINGATLFNHARDPSFDNCTKAGCHETFNAEMKDYEDHGMHQVTTDEFCHACHDYMWTGWPPSDVY